MQSFRLELFTVFEIQGSKLKKKKKNEKKQKNWENELFVISPLLVMQFLPYFRYTCMLPIVTIVHPYHKTHSALYRDGQGPPHHRCIGL